MALEASDRLIDIIWVNSRCICGCISRPTFKLSASLLDIMGKSKELNQELRKRILDFRPPQVWFILGAISKRLKVPRSSVQTIVWKYTHHGTTQPDLSNRSRRSCIYPWSRRYAQNKYRPADQEDLCTGNLLWNCQYQLPPACETGGIGMSSEIYYDRAFIRVGDRFIPVVNHGSSNCFDFDAQDRKSTRLNSSHLE